MYKAAKNNKNKDENKLCL